MRIFSRGAQKNSELVGILRRLRESKVGRRISPVEDVHTLIPRACDYAVLEAKGRRAAGGINSVLRSAVHPG